MFSFHHHLPNTDGNPLYHWAIMLATYDRLNAHGIPATLHLNKNVPGGQLALLSGRTMFTSNSDGHEIAPLEWPSLDRGRALNAATWLGVSSEQLADALSSAEQQVNLALEVSIYKWFRQPESQRNLLSLEARLWAAQQLGFDVFKIHYHETHADNVDNLMKNGFDLQRALARRSDDGVPDGVFFKPDAAPLELSDTPVQIPFLLKKGETLVCRDRDHIKELMMCNPGIQVVKNQLENTDAREGERYDVMMEEFRKDTRNMALGARLDACLDEWKSEVRRLATSVRQMFTDQLKGQGVRYLFLEQDKGSFGRMVASTIALYPEDICPAHVKQLPLPHAQLKALPASLEVTPQDHPSRQTLDFTHNVPAPRNR